MEKRGIITPSHHPRKAFVNPPLAFGLPLSPTLPQRSDNMKDLTPALDGSVPSVRIAQCLYAVDVSAIKDILRKEFGYLEDWFLECEEGQVRDYPLPAVLERVKELSHGSIVDIHWGVSTRHSEYYEIEDYYIVFEIFNGDIFTEEVFCFIADEDGPVGTIFEYDTDALFLRWEDRCDRKQEEEGGQE